MLTYVRYNYSVIGSIGAYGVDNIVRSKPALYLLMSSLCKAFFFFSQLSDTLRPFRVLFLLYHGGKALGSIKDIAAYGKVGRDILVELRAVYVDMDYSEFS